MLWRNFVKSGSCATLVFFALPYADILTLTSASTAKSTNFSKANKIFIHRRSLSCGLLDNERWGRKGTSRWMDIEFDGGEDGDSEVNGVAIAFLRGHRRIAFFDVRSVSLEERKRAREEGRGGLFVESSASGVGKVCAFSVDCCAYPMLRSRNLNLFDDTQQKTQRTFVVKRRVLHFAL